MHFIRSVGVWVTARFDVLFMSLNVTKTINIFLAHFRFLKKLQIFLMLLHKMISIYIYSWWVEDVSFQSTRVVPCIRTNTGL